MPKRTIDGDIIVNQDALAALKNNLWNSPPVPPESLSEEQRKKYAESGLQMYGQMDFENLESSINDKVAYIVLQLRSGLHHSYLSDDDRCLMDGTYGDGWEARFSVEH